ncbi:hypothetical protein V6000_000351 [Aspergillus fumigatus]
MQTYISASTSLWFTATLAASIFSFRFCRQGANLPQNYRTFLHITEGKSQDTRQYFKDILIPSTMGRNAYNGLNFVSPRSIHPFNVAQGFSFDGLEETNRPETRQSEAWNILASQSMCT